MAFTPNDDSNIKSESTGKNDQFSNAAWKEIGQTNLSPATKKQNLDQALASIDTSESRFFLIGDQQKDLPAAKITLLDESNRNNFKDTRKLKGQDLPTKIEQEGNTYSIDYDKQGRPINVAVQDSWHTDINYDDDKRTIELKQYAVDPSSPQNGEQLIKSASQSFYATNVLKKEEITDTANGGIRTTLHEFSPSGEMIRQFRSTSDEYETGTSETISHHEGDTTIEQTVERNENNQKTTSIVYDSEGTVESGSQEESTANHFIRTKMVKDLLNTVMQTTVQNLDGQTDKIIRIAHSKFNGQISHLAVTDADNKALYQDLEGRDIQSISTVDTEKGRFIIKSITYKDAEGKEHTLKNDSKEAKSLFQKLAGDIHLTPNIFDFSPKLYEAKPTTEDELFYDNFSPQEV